MNKNPQMTIQPACNGYVIELSWQEKDDKDFYEYRSEKHVFSDWDGVVNYIKENQF